MASFSLGKTVYAWKPPKPLDLHDGVVLEGLEFFYFFSGGFHFQVDRYGTTQDVFTSEVALLPRLGCIWLYHDS